MGSRLDRVSCSQGSIWSLAVVEIEVVAERGAGIADAVMAYRRTEIFAQID